MSGMSSLSSAHDQYGEVDVDPSRYSWALRRARLPIAAAALLGGLAAAGLFGTTNNFRETRFVLEPDHEVLGSTGLDDAIDEIPTPVEANEFIKGFAIDEGFAATSVVDPAAEDVIALVVNASSQSGVDADEGLIIAALNSWITERRAAAVGPVLDVVSAQSASASSRLVELDGEIASLEGQDALRDAYLAERSDLNADLRRLDRQSQALQSYAASSDHIEVVGHQGRASNSRALWLVIGLFLGALVAALAVIIRAYGDRRVRTRSELCAVADAPMLAMVPSDGPQAQPAVASLQAAAQRLRTDGPVYLVPVEGARAGDVVQLDTVGNGFESYSMSSGSPLADGSRVAVAAKWGASHADDVAVTCLNLRAMGCRVVGCVLADVPAKELRRSMA